MNIERALLSPPAKVPGAKHAAVNKTVPTFNQLLSQRVTEWTQGSQAGSEAPPTLFNTDPTGLYLGDFPFTVLIQLLTTFTGTSAGMRAPWRRGLYLSVR